MSYDIMNKFMGFNTLRRFLDYRTLSIKITADGKDVPKKKHFETRITLIGTDNSLSITDLKNAQSLSVRRDLKLVKIQDEDSKTRRPVYKLMTSAQYHEEELSKRKEKQASRNNVSKGQKLLNLNTKIADHDIMTNVKKIKKLLEKQYEVKVVISGSDENSDSYERIYSVMEKNLSSIGRLLQKRTKGNTLRFQLLPMKDMSTSAENNSKDSDNANDKGPL